MGARRQAPTGERCVASVVVAAALEEALLAPAGHLLADPGAVLVGGPEVDASPAREIALGRLDVHVARTAAPWAALANERGYDSFSARVGCQAYNPAFGLELGSLCIRRDE